jgi:16S rRNA C967 or C1407 C5-methylase (RsmB/RsmF family)
MMFPPSFVDSLIRALGQPLAQETLDAIQTPAPVSVRVNPNKNMPFEKQGFENVHWCASGIYLLERPRFSADPFLHLGYYYVQEASSMIVGEIVKDLLSNNESLVLDLCAAPGGKSTHIASILKANDVLVSNEVISNRAPILEENLSKWGCANHMVTRADSEFWGRSGLFFDVVVADLPCSGEGMFRKDSEAIKQWSPANVELCAQRQRRIVSEVWKAVKPGGFLVYSTCTLNRTENEENLLLLKSLPGFNPVPIKTAGLSSFVETEPNMYRALPGKVKGEGFFVAVIQKLGADDNKQTISKNRSFTTVENEGLWPSDIVAFQKDDEVYASRGDGDLFFKTLKQLPGSYSPGVCIGKLIRNVFKPNARLALLQGIEECRWPAYNLSDSEVMAYLRRDTLHNPEGVSETVLAHWNNHAVGFLSPNKNRWNNLWPMEWRLRMDAPEPACCFA